MQKMASNKQASSGNGEKLLRCAGSLFALLGPSLSAERDLAVPCSPEPSWQPTGVAADGEGLGGRCSHHLPRLSSLPSFLKTSFFEAVWLQSAGRGFAAFRAPFLAVAERSAAA